MIIDFYAGGPQKANEIIYIDYEKPKMFLLKKFIGAGSSYLFGL